MATEASLTGAHKGPRQNRKSPMHSPPSKHRRRRHSARASVHAAAQPFSSATVASKRFMCRVALFHLPDGPVSSESSQASFSCRTDLPIGKPDKHWNRGRFMPRAIRSFKSRGSSRPASRTMILLGILMSLLVTLAPSPASAADPRETMVLPSVDNLPPVQPAAPMDPATTPDLGPPTPAQK